MTWAVAMPHKGWDREKDTALGFISGRVVNNQAHHAKLTVLGKSLTCSGLL
jgi:hypothetical protein